jgi:hypothetical protein
VRINILKLSCVLQKPNQLKAHKYLIISKKLNPIFLFSTSKELKGKFVRKTIFSLLAEQEFSYILINTFLRSMFSICALKHEKEMKGNENRGRE